MLLHEQLIHLLYEMALLSELDEGNVPRKPIFELTDATPGRITWEPAPKYKEAILLGELIECEPAWRTTRFKISVVYYIVL